jgi:hypothetical protein
MTVEPGTGAVPVTQAARDRTCQCGVLAEWNPARSGPQLPASSGHSGPGAQVELVRVGPMPGPRTLKLVGGGDAPSRVLLRLAAEA